MHRGAGDRARRRLRPSRAPTTETADRRCRRAPAPPAPRGRYRRRSPPPEGPALARSARATSPRARHCASDGARSCQPRVRVDGRQRQGARARVGELAQRDRASAAPGSSSAGRGRPGAVRPRPSARAQLAQDRAQVGLIVRGAAARRRCGRKPRPPVGRWRGGDVGPQPIGQRASRCERRL